MANGLSPIFTIGHSTRPIDTFLALLAETRVECVVDVRRLPGSRAQPQYNADALAASLDVRGIDYWHATALGGLRRSGEVAEGSTFWTNASFRRYAAYSQTPAFARGLAEAEVRARAQRCVLMCAEAVWWRCHRRIIADWLLARGHGVFHIMGAGKMVRATLTQGASIVDATPVYPSRPSMPPEASSSRNDRSKPS